MRFTEIGQQLRAYRLESGLRAEEIAARLGVSRAALYRYEKGEVIKLDTIKRLAELLKISPLSLLGIGVEYYNRPIGYFERLRQVEETADQILQVARPALLPHHLGRLRRGARPRRSRRPPSRPARARQRCAAMAEQVLGILAARKRMYAMRRPGIIAMIAGLRDPALPGGRRGRRAAAVRPAAADLPPGGGDRGGEHRRPDGSRADGPAIRPADRPPSPAASFTDPARARPGEPGDQPVPARHAPERTDRRRHDHRRRRGDRRAPARGRGELAGGDQGRRRRGPAPPASAQLRGEA